MNELHFNKYLQEIANGSVPGLTGHTLTANQIELIRLELEKVKCKIDDYFRVMVLTRLER